MRTSNSATDVQALWDALEHLRSAIEILDSAGAPAHIAAHVDLAMNQLQEAIPTVPAGAASPHTSAPDIH